MMNTRLNPVPFVTAVAIILAAITLFDVMSAIIKHLSQTYPTPQLSMFRNLFGLIPTLLILFWSQSWIKAGRPVVIRQWKLALARGGLGVFAQISFYLALFRLEFATATTIAFAGPLFITALSIPLLGHRVGFWRWLAVLIGFIGVIMVMRPTAESFTWYVFLPLIAAFGYASISVTARLFDEAVPTAVLNIYYNVGALTGSVVLVIATGSYIQIGSNRDTARLDMAYCYGFCGGRCRVLSDHGVQVGRAQQPVAV